VVKAVSGIFIWTLGVATGLLSLFFSQVLAEKKFWAVALKFDIVSTVIASVPPVDPIFLSTLSINFLAFGFTFAKGSNLC
jgi:hypothetical protein